MRLYGIVTARVVSPPSRNQMITSRLGRLAILMMGLVTASIQEVSSQVDSLELMVTADYNYPLFKIDVGELGSILRTVDSVRARGGSTLCSFAEGRVPCAVFTDTASSTPWENFVLYDPPYQELGRRRVLFDLHLRPTDFGYDTVSSRRFRLNTKWIPARMSRGGNDSIRAWLREIENSRPICGGDGYCLTLVFETWDFDPQHLRVISECSLLPGGVVPFLCEPLAIWDSREWWIPGIVGHILYRNPRGGDHLAILPAGGDFDFLIQGRVDLANVMAAVARGLSAVPRPNLETTQRPGVVLGSANRRVSPVLQPYREIVDILVTVSPYSSRGYSLWIRPHILVNRYNDSDDRSYHLPSPADGERYRTVVRATIRRYLSSVCSRPSWSSQILTCR